MSFTRQHYILIAEMLGSHVIPMCLARDYGRGGVLNWNSEAVLGFHRMGHEMIDHFQRDNPSFNVKTFNKKMLYHAQKALSDMAPYRIHDLPGFEMAGRNAPPNDWTFVPSPLDVELFKI